MKPEPYEPAAGLAVAAPTDDAAQVLARAASRRAELGLSYAGAVTPPEA